MGLVLRHAMCGALAVIAVQGSLYCQALPRLAERAEYPEGLGFVHSVRELADGRLLVADPLGQVLLRIDMGNGVADTIGRTGAGPREYRQPDRVIPLPGDSTLLVDLGNGRLSVIAPDGSFGATMPIATADPNGRGDLFTVLPRFADASGAVYYQPIVGIPGSPTGDSVPVYRLERSSRRRSPVAMLKVQESSEQTTRRGAGVARIVRPMPLTPSDDWAVTTDGAVVVVRSADYHAEWIRPDGAVIVGEAVPYRPVRVGRGEKAAWIQARATGGLNFNWNNNNGRTDIRFSRGQRGGRLADPSSFEWPAVMPPFVAGRTLVSPRGEVWVERSVAAGAPPMVDLFDAQARWLGSIALPRGRHVVGFGAASVYLTRTDDVGLMWLERVRLAYPD